MKPIFGRALLGGFLGTAVLTMMMKFVAPLMGVHMDIAQNLANMMHATWAFGMVAHIMNGTLIFPAVFTFLLYRVLPGTSVTKGLIWGGILWLILEVAVMPMLGMGIFGSSGPGMAGATAALIAHLIYGGIVGAATGQMPRPVRVVHTA